MTGVRFIPSLKSGVFSTPVPQQDKNLFLPDRIFGPGTSVYKGYNATAKQKLSCVICFWARRPILGPTCRNEFISLLINFTHALRRVRKGRFDTEKQEKGRKKAAVRGRVPQKQGLKQDNWHGQEMVAICPRASSTKTRIETHMSPGRGSHVTDGKPHIVIRSR